MIPSRVSGCTFQDGALRNAEFTSDTWALLTVIALSNWSSSPLYGMAGEMAEMYLGR